MIKKAIKNFDASVYDPKTVIGEFSGRDSVAAILKMLGDETINHILPIATFAGTEYGDFDGLYENYIKMLDIVKQRYGDEKKIYDLLEFNDEKLWAIMAGRVQSLVNSKYGVISPCIPCHLYFHLTKVEFAKVLSGTIISGERESHDGRIKVNQLDVSLNAYVKIIEKTGCNLVMPLRKMTAGHQVEELIGWDWQEGKDHPKCVLSGNYRDQNGKAVYDEVMTEKYIEAFLVPMGSLIGKWLLSGTRDYKKLEKEVLALI